MATGSGITQSIIAMDDVPFYVGNRGELLALHYAIRLNSEQRTFDQMVVKTNDKSYPQEARSILEKKSEGFNRVVTYNGYKHQ
jgi:hypothetical protein